MCRRIRRVDVYLYNMMYMYDMRDRVINMRDCVVLYDLMHVYDTGDRVVNIRDGAIVISEKCANIQANLPSRPCRRRCVVYVYMCVCGCMCVCVYVSVSLSVCLLVHLSNFRACV